MYIEFYGLSGSGKTTSSLILKEILNLKYHRKNIKINRLSMLSFKSYISALKISLKINFISRKISPLYLFHNINAFFICFYHYNYSKFGGLSTGHGFIQTFSQINDLEKEILKNPKKIKGLFKNLPQDLNLISLDINKDVAQKRAQKRSNQYLDNHKYDLDERFYKIINKDIFIKKRTKSINANLNLKSIKKELKKYKDDFKNK